MATLEAPTTHPSPSATSPAPVSSAIVPPDTVSSAAVSPSSAGWPGGATFTIAEAAQVTGVSVHTLRYYERAGLMREPVARASSRHRRYTDEDVQWVTFLTKLRSTGMPIRDIARYAVLVREGEGNESERLTLLTEHRRRVLERLDEVQRNLAAINMKIDLYEERTVR